jgi:pantetheine-phosphate adenylyltransferase
VNSGKKPTFTREERMELSAALCSVQQREVEQSDDLTVRYAKSRGASVIVKGLRAVSDFDWEFQMALANKKIEPPLKTVFSPPVKSIRTFHPASSRISRSMAGISENLFRGKS